MKLLMGTLVVLAGAHAATAAGAEKSLSGHLSTGYSMTQGVTSDFLQDGWIVSGGWDWKPWAERRFSLRFDLHYSAYDATNELIDLGGAATGDVRIDDGDATVWGANLNGVYRLGPSDAFHGYLTAGVGEYQRNVNLSQTVLVGGIYCDPWSGFCYPSVIPGQSVLVDQSTTRFAWNAGVGVEFPLGVGGGALFFELSYHVLETSNKPTEFIPLQVGIRF